MVNKVVFVNPPADMKVVREGRCEQRADSYQYLMVPISIPSTAALLRQEGFEVKIYDCIADEIGIGRLATILKQENPFLVIVNVATMSFDKDKQTATVCKELGFPVAAMGMHVTTIPEQALKDSDFDYVIRGEPEMISLHLAQGLAEKTPLKKIKGIAFWEGDKVVINEAAELIQNPDDLPFPARDLINNEKYIEPITHRPYTLIIAGRGCPYKCTFCTATRYYGTEQRIRSPKSIVDEMEEIVEKHGIAQIGMWSDTFTFNKAQVIGMCKEIINRGLKVRWYCNSRVDTLDEERIVWMARSGCKAITFGVESLDEEVLEKAKKGIMIEDVDKAVKLCQRYGVECQLHMIFGLPGETKQSIHRSIKRVIEIDPDYAQFYCAIPFPGTEFRDYVAEKGYIKDVPWGMYEFNNALVNYPHLSSQEIQEARKMAYRKFYFRPKFVLRTARKIPVKDWKKVSAQAASFFKGWVVSGG